MADPYVRDLGFVKDMEGAQIRIKVDYDSVLLGAYYHNFRLNRTQAEEFAKIFVTACWEAGANGRQMELGELERGDA